MKLSHNFGEVRASKGKTQWEHIQIDNFWINTLEIQNERTNKYLLNEADTLGNVTHTRILFYIITDGFMTLLKI